LRENSLAPVFHARAQAGHERVHFRARGSGFHHEKLRAADLDGFSDQRDKVDPGGFNVGPDLAWAQARHSQGSGMAGHLLALDECDLPFGGLSRGAAPPVEVATVARHAFLRDEFAVVHLDHGLARRWGMQMQGGHPAANRRSFQLIHAGLIGSRGRKSKAPIFPVECSTPGFGHTWVGPGGEGGAVLDKLIGQWQFAAVVATKLDQLRALLRSCGSCLVAYSGGVDSVFLARVAHEALGEKALAVIADSPSLPRRELAEALEVAARFAIPVRVVQTGEFQNAEYLANPANRCYFCKHELFTELVPIARQEGFAVIAYGENASDVGDHRPGAQAAAEFQIRAPLKEVGLTKAEIRELSAQLGLPTADKPQMACLSSRIPYGEGVTPEKLRMIEQAEYVLKDLGFHDVRVRHHELRGGHLARIEVGLEELPRFADRLVFEKVNRGLKELGYAHAVLDLEGYRRGSMNISFRPPARESGVTPM
jgi:pyridinium-3,5-biscarboxylic acid mononucleotide sulfurtransferase